MNLYDHIRKMQQQELVIHLQATDHTGQLFHEVQQQAREWSRNVRVGKAVAASHKALQQRLLNGYDCRLN